MSSKTDTQMESILVDAKQLHSALTRAVGAVESRKSFPILQCVRIATDGEELEIIASDMDSEARLRIPVEGVRQPICIESARLIAIAGQLKDRGQIELRFARENGRITCAVVSGRSRFTLETMAAADFPELAHAGEAVNFSLSGKQFGRVLQALSPAVYDMDNRPYLCGVFLERGTLAKAGDPGFLTAVAVNGHMLAARHFELPDLDPAMPSIIVPKSVCGTIVKLFGDADRLQVSASANRIALQVDGIVFVSKLIEGIYPDWRRVTPMREPTHSFDAPALIKSIELAHAATAGAGGKAIKLTVGAEETTIEARDIDKPGFTGADVCPHSAFADPGMPEIGVNASYLLDMLRNLDAETVLLSLPPTMEKPFVITAAALNDRIATIMPMRV